MVFESNKVLLKSAHKGIIFYWAVLIILEKRERSNDWTACSMDYLMEPTARGTKPHTCDLAIYNCRYEPPGMLVEFIMYPAVGLLTKVTDREALFACWEIEVYRLSESAPQYNYICTIEKVWKMAFCCLFSGRVFCPNFDKAFHFYTDIL